MPKDDKKVRNIHDRRFPRPVETTSIPDSPVRLSQGEAEKLGEMNHRLMEARGSLADTCMDAGMVRSEIDRLEKILESLNQNVTKAEGVAIKIKLEYKTELEKIALIHGIPVGDEKAGIWRHDTAAGTIVRVEQKVSQPSGTPATPSPEN